MSHDPSEIIPIWWLAAQKTKIYECLQQYILPETINTFLKILYRIIFKSTAFIWNRNVLQQYIYIYIYIFTVTFDQLKRIVRPQRKMCSLSGHLRCRWVCFFIRTDLKKCSITSLTYQWILCSEWVPSEWESKQLIKTSQYSTSNSYDSKSNNYGDCSNHQNYTIRCV